MPQPLTVLHAGSHGGLKMRLIDRAQQHQHPSTLRRKETPAASEPAGTPSFEEKAFYWLGGKSIKLHSDPIG